MHKIKTTVASYEEFTDIDFNMPATFYIRNSLGDYVFYHTRDRAKAQAAVDEDYDKGRYIVKASKLQKTVSKLESGDVSCRGTQTMRKTPK